MWVSYAFHCVNTGLMYSWIPLYKFVVRVIEDECHILVCGIMIVARYGASGILILV